MRVLCTTLYQTVCLTPRRHPGRHKSVLDEKRSQARYDYPATIEYVMDSRSNEGAVQKAVTVNISAGGLAAYVFDPLREGQRIIIKTSLPVAFQAATICWIRKEDHSFYLSGLKFV